MVVTLVKRPLLVLLAPYAALHAAVAVPLGLVRYCGLLRLIAAYCGLLRPTPRCTPPSPSRRAWCAAVAMMIVVAEEAVIAAYCCLLRLIASYVVAEEAEMMMMILQRLQ